MIARVSIQYPFIKGITASIRILAAYFHHHSFPAYSFYAAIIFRNWTQKHTRCDQSSLIIWFTGALLLSLLSLLSFTPVTLLQRLHASLAYLSVFGVKPFNSVGSHNRG